MYVSIPLLKYTQCVDSCSRPANESNRNLCCRWHIRRSWAAAAELECFFEHRKRLERLKTPFIGVSAVKRRRIPDDVPVSIAASTTRSSREIHACCDDQKPREMTMPIFGTDNYDDQRYLSTTLLNYCNFYVQEVAPSVNISSYSAINVFNKSKEFFKRVFLQNSPPYLPHHPSSRRATVVDSKSIVQHLQP